MLPLAVGALDHYTLIVPDAKAAARFHIEVLGFRYLRSQALNAGSAPAGEFDMLNEILEIGSMPGRTCVITEGLTETSIFRRYLDRYGAGVHHIGYAVDDIEEAVAALNLAEVKLTSESIVVDALSGLRQVFIDRRHAGYFIELIERPRGGATDVFAAPNMIDLARSITSHLEPVSHAESTASAPATPSIDLAASVETVQAFLLDPANLGRWTCHRTVRRIDGVWREIRAIGDIQLEIRRAGDDVVFRWSHEGLELVVAFDVRATPAGSTVRIRLPALAEARLQLMTPLLQAELRILKGILDGQPGANPAHDHQLVADHHLRIYQRTGL